MPLVSPPAHRPVGSLVPQQDQSGTMLHHCLSGLARLAGRLVHAPAGCVILGTGEQQVLVVQCISDETGPVTDASSHLHALCHEVVTTAEPVVIGNAQWNPLVPGECTAARGFAAFLGVPVTPDGAPTVGALCAIDMAPRQWSSSDVEGLRELAAIASSQIGLMLPANGAGAATPEADAAARRYRDTFERAPLGIAHLSLDARYLAANERLCDLVGYDRTTLLSGSFHDLSHPADMAADLDLLRRLGQGQIPSYQLEKRCRHRAGHDVWTILTMSLVRDAAGQPDYLIAAVEDISGRKRTAAALHETEAGLRDAHAEVLERLAQAAELRDDDTGLHTRRVGMLSARIGAALGLRRDDVDLLRQASPLHDVGKIGVPDQVLLKAGSLDPDERACIERHAAFGARILAGSSAPLIRLAESIALSHHERWDGTGYPRKLAGDAIPLAARIVAVADVFDALTHARPYRDAWPRERAIAFITAGSGAHFDPRVVEAFLRLEQPGEC